MGGGQFVGAAAFSGTGGGEVQYNALTGIIAGDVDGSGTTDWQVILPNKAVLTAADFVF